MSSFVSIQNKLLIVFWFLTKAITEFLNDQNKTPTKFKLLFYRNCRLPVRQPIAILLLIVNTL